ncbi:MAG: molybdenum cofactor guanylyltransferase [Ignavibacteria bacterium]|nr:molybdenum cofactor guanylyltransferase [Ignavibacteria bacterium]
MSHLIKTYGLVVCGGNSSRMGYDKGLITYHEKPHKYHLYEMLELFFDKVFISCNLNQSDITEEGYVTLADLPCYENKGPMAALLTAFTSYPENDFLVIGCDYPFISKEEISKFLKTITNGKEAAAFYNAGNDLYEPLIAWYSCRSFNLLRKLFYEGNYSLQYFLRSIDADKYFPTDRFAIMSADTPDDRSFSEIILKQQNIIKNEN